ncbi:MAG: hypothetical protein K2J74_01930 [Muribaculaceae bacterium]|nr:hypothetical protein [Muribaculaceae bacterium]
MVTNNSSTLMSKEDVKRFCDNVSRHMKKEYTGAERMRFEQAKKTYESIIKNNGGKNPILGF